MDLTTYPPYALIIIDMQNDFLDRESPFYIQEAASSIPKIKKLLDFFRDKDWPVFHIIRYYREDGSDVENIRLSSFLSGQKAVLPQSHGSEIVAELYPQGQEYIIVKQRFSAFMATELDFILRRRKLENLVICGTQLPVCVRETLFDAIAFDYKPLLITDGCSAKEEVIAQANIKDIANMGVPCLTTEEFIENNGSK